MDGLEELCEGERGSSNHRKVVWASTENCAVDTVEDTERIVLLKHYEISSEEKSTTVKKYHHKSEHEYMQMGVRK